MRGLYTLAFYLAIPLILLRLLWRGFRAPDYLRRWPERFGFFRAPDAGGAIWVHAVSVGEVQAALPLLRSLLQRYPRYPLTVTTTTPTGSRRLVESLGEAVFHVYLPYDLPDVLARFFTRVQPRLLVVMETELWPNLFRACRNHGVGLVIANARLSPRSFGRYQRVAGLIGRTLGDVTLVAAQSAADADRFQALGAGRVRVAGNIKFDLQVSEQAIEKGHRLRGRLGRQRPVLIAASTHQGEDEWVLDALTLIRAEIDDALLILVPRHPERFDAVADLCRARRWRVGRHSHDTASVAVDVWLGDTMGDMMLLMAASDLAFVGGSVVPVGGHNVLEPAALGMPVAFGPHMHNFVEAGDLLLAAGAAHQVETPAQLAAWFVSMQRDPRMRSRAAAAGLGVVADNRGALDRLLDQIAPLLEPERSKV